MVEKVLQINGVTPQELKESIVEDFKTELENFSKSFQPVEQQKYLTRDEVASILQISISTISYWNRKGILNPYRVGNKIRYKSSEIDEALIQINSKQTA